MYKRYDREITDMLSDKLDDADREIVLERHKLMLKRIFNERLIHLLVTIFVGIVMSATFFVLLVTENILLLFLAIPLLILFVGYLFHYRFLENLNQKWYEIEDRIIQYKK